MSFVKLSTAPPNPITDDEIDESDEANEYKYPNFEKATAPYWKSFPKETRDTMMRHDYLELHVLGRVRPLDFKLRDAWTIEQAFND